MCKYAVSREHSKKQQRILVEIAENQLKHISAAVANIINIDIDNKNNTYTYYVCKAKPIQHSKLFLCHSAAMYAKEQ